MTKRKGLMAGFLASTAMLGFLAVLGFLALRTVPADNKDFFNMALVALIGLVGTAFGYYLGSSEGSARKNELLAPTPLQEIPPSGPVGSEKGFARVPLLATAALAGILTLVGCASLKDTSPQAKASQVLLSMQATVVSVAQVADDMCTQGTLNQNQCDQVAQVYRQTAAAYDLAADALQVAIEAGGSPGAWDAYLAAHNRFLTLYRDMYAAAGEFGLLKTVEGGAR